MIVGVAGLCGAQLLPEWKVPLRVRTSHRTTSVLANLMLGLLVAIEGKRESFDDDASASTPTSSPSRQKRLGI